MRYFGSKTSVADALLTELARRGATGGTFCDAFGGLGTVGAAAKQRGFRVHSGDQLRFAYCFQVARIGLSGLPPFRRLRSDFAGARAVEAHLQSLDGSDGWLVDEFAERRRFFTRDNAARVERCRQQIWSWTHADVLSPREHALLVASLVDSMDRVANTAGTYYAYLKHWHRKALRPFRFSLLVPQRGIPGHPRLADALELVGSGAFDVVYLDPPYNARRYGGYYHLPETIALGDEPIARGLAGVSERPQPQSAFYSATTATSAFETLVSAAECRHLVFHYTTGGLITLENAREILKRHRGNIDEVKLRAPGYSTRPARRRQVEHHLFISHA